MAYAQVREIIVEENGKLNVEGLTLRAGDRVRVVVIRQSGTSGGSERYPLHGQPLRYEAPFEPAVNPQDWEANQ